MDKKYKEYLKSEEWAKIRIDLFNSRGKKCEDCGNTTKLHIHHLHYSNIFKEEPEDLKILCSECHAKVHNKVKLKAAKKLKKIKPGKSKKKNKLNIYYKSLERIERRNKNGYYKSDHIYHIAKKGCLTILSKELLKGIKNRY